MRPSKFNLNVRDCPERGRTSVYNTLTQGLAVLEDKMFEGLNEGEALAPDELKALESSGIIVPEGMDEDLLFDLFYNQIRFDNSTLKVTLLTTLSCNFACRYCYEGSLTSGTRHMSPDTADLAVSWIKARAVERKASEIWITFLGGEPLMNIPVMERVGREIKAFCDEKGMSLTSHVVSNGYLLNRENALRISRAGIQSVKVTLDGPAEAHDSQRSLKGGGGTFGAILKNLRETKDILSIRIGGNFTRESAPRIPELLDELISADLGPDAVYKMGFTPVMPSDAVNDTNSADTGCIPVGGMHDEYINIQREVLRRGFNTYTEPGISPCPVVNASDFTIGHDGSIYKCPCLVDRPGFAVGNITDDFGYNGEMVRCLGMDIFDRKACRACPVLPLCLGGCRFLSLVTGGKFHEVNCQRETIEAIAVEYVRRMAEN